jgi:hypothetical protein
MELEPVRSVSLKTCAIAVGQIVELAVLGAERERPELLCGVDKYIPVRGCAWPDR